jgi:hypothetical protein
MDSDGRRAAIGERLGRDGRVVVAASAEALAVPRVTVRLPP